MKNLIRNPKVLLSLFLLAIISVACGGSPTVQETGDLKGSIAVSGAWALYPMMTRWAEEYHNIHPAVEFDISAGGAGKGMADALVGAVDIGMVSRDIRPEEEAKGAYWIAVTKDAVFPTINALNPVLSDLLEKGVTQETFAKIFITAEITSWGQVVGRSDVTDEIHLYTRSDACGAAETWAKYIGGRQDDLGGIAVFGDPGLLNAVVTDQLGIGYNNLGYAYDMTTGEPVDGAFILPIDQNSNGRADEDELLETKAEAIEMVATGKYPSPPARVLNLVTNGKPGGIVRDFIEWVLTDGQEFVGEAGYIQLTNEQLGASLEKLQ